MNIKNYRNFLIKSLVVFVGYFLLAHLGLYFATINKNASPFWPASGFAFFILTVFGVRYAPFIFLSALLKNVQIGSSVEVSLLIGFGVTLEAIAAKWIFLNLLKKRTLLTHYGRFVAVFIASAISSTIGASLGAISLAFGEITTPNLYLTSWFTWYGGDLIGSLFVFSLLMSIRSRWKARKGPTWRETSTVVFSLIAFAVILYFSHSIALLMFAFPLLLNCLRRAGITGTLVFLNFVALLCAISNQLNVGPFQDGPMSINLLCHILFLLSLGFAALVLIAFYRADAIRANIRFLAILWLIAFGTTFVLDMYAQNKDTSHFLDLSIRAKNRIERRMGDYERVLLGAAAFYRASDLVTKEDWRSFTQDYNVTQFLPGVLGIGFVQNVPKKDLKKFLKKAEEEGLPNFQIFSLPHESLSSIQFDNYFVVKFIEPEQTNKGIVGLDVGGGLSRREAAEMSIDSGQPTLIDNIHLLQDPLKRMGFLLMVPIYQRHQDISTPELRRQFHVGWAYAPFVAEEFMKHALDDQLDELSVYIHEPGSKSTLFKTDSSKASNKHRSKFYRQYIIKLAQKNYLMEIFPSKSFLYSRDQMTAWAGALSIILGLFMAMILVNLQLINRRIHQQVKVRTQELLMTQKMAESHRAISIEASRLASLGEMAGSIAHEINNPLSIILAKIFNLKNRLKRQPVEATDVLKYVDKIEETSYRIAKIVSGMRTLSHDGSQFEIEDFPLNKIIEDSLDICREKFKSKGIEILVETPENIYVKCRPIQIAQVLINLLNNSEQAIEGQTDAWVQIRTSMKDSKAFLEVTDSGPGIPQEIVHRMMEPFFTTKEVGKGTGLGLSIGRNIMKEHQGSLEYRSGPNTCFVIVFTNGCHIPGQSIT